MIRTPVESSNIDSIGYVHDSQTLQIAFKAKDGVRAYNYANVPPELYQEFMAAESKGKFFIARIKGNPAYPCEKVG